MPLPLLAAAAIAGGASLAGSAFNAFEQQQTNDQNLLLSRTAHQREVNDLRAAGLNPILSAGGKGAPMPSLSPPQMDLGGAAKSGLSAMMDQATLRNVQANTEKALAEASSAKSTAAVNAHSILADEEVRNNAAGISRAAKLRADVEGTSKVLGAYQGSLLDTYDTTHSAAKAARLGLPEKEAYSLPFQLLNSGVHSAKRGLDAFTLDWNSIFNERNRAQR